jgi:ribosomal protein L16 Arg81 hydroxylase
MSRRITALDEEFDRLFTRFRYTAFRLETLQQYDVPYEVEQIRRFLAGEDPLEDSYNPAKNHWFGMLRESYEVGKRVQRVHVIEEPLSDYIRFELAWPYQETVSAG